MEAQHLGQSTDQPHRATVDNPHIAELLEEMGSRLERQGANFFRVRAYRRGARAVRMLPREAADIHEQAGLAGLREVPGIGVSLAKSVAEIVQTGRLTALEQLRPCQTPEGTLIRIPAIGPKLAARIHGQLHLDTLGDLEAASYDGRLAAVPGIGRARIQAVRTALSGSTRQRAPSPLRSATVHRPAREPPVSQLLDVDHEYREKATAGRLPTISPRQFNPLGQSWLPIMHTIRSGTRYTAFYSNTARALTLGMSHDWVIIRSDEQRDHQWTVITARLGPLHGLRIVRGREDDCRQYYRDERQNLLPFGAANANDN